MQPRSLEDISYEDGLAAVKLQYRRTAEKRAAAPKSTLADLAAQLEKQAAGGEGWLKTLLSSPELQYALLGGGVGAGVGALSTLGQKKERRRPLQRGVTGGVIGALLGGSGAFLLPKIHEYLSKEPDAGGGDDQPSWMTPELEEWFEKATPEQREAGARMFEQHQKAETLGQPTALQWWPGLGELAPSGPTALAMGGMGTFGALRHLQGNRQWNQMIANALAAGNNQPFNPAQLAAGQGKTGIYRIPFLGEWMWRRAVMGKTPHPFRNWNAPVNLGPNMPDPGAVRSTWNANKPGLGGTAASALGYASIPYGLEMLYKHLLNPWRSDAQRQQYQRALEEMRRAAQQAGLEPPAM